MDFELSDDQQALQSELRRFLTDRVTPEARRAAGEQQGAVDRALWAELAGMGISMDFHKELTEKYGVPIELIRAVMMQESGGDPNNLAATGGAVAAPIGGAVIRAALGPVR